MIVLSRRKNESILIGNAVTLRVTELSKDAVRLGTETVAGRKQEGPPLSRRKSESLALPGNVTVTVIDISQDKVRLGVTAPRDVPIYRSELYTPIHQREALKPKVRIVPLSGLGHLTPATRTTARLKPKVRVIPLKEAIRDGRAFLNDGQYVHLTDIVRRLTHWNSPEEISDLRIEPIQGLWELKEKGGLLGRLNVRVFFAVLEERREVVVLGAFKKENEDQTPRHIVIRMKNRLRVYLDRHAR